MPQPFHLGALGRDRTCDLRFRKPVLYPLSYEGGDGAKCGALFADTLRVISIEVTQPWAGQRRLQCLVDDLSPIYWFEDHPLI